MQIILSPTKTMRQDTAAAPRTVPVYLEDTRRLLARLQTMPYADLQAMWGCNESLGLQNQQRLAEMDLSAGLTPALFTYEGISFQYLDADTLTEPQLDWMQEHLHILSGFYGALRPMDGIRPYRLEMQSRLRVDDKKDLYAFWGGRLYQAVRDDSGVIVNLASKEYAKCIEKYLTPADRCITCIFGEMVKGRLVQKGTFAKMARGLMVRYLAETAAQTPEAMQGFSQLGFAFRPDLSSDTTYVFERTPE